MKNARAVLLTTSLVGPLLAASCVAVPDLRFADEPLDGAAQVGDGDGSADDAAPDGPLPSDASQDALQDATTEAGTCALPAPAGGTCCGAVYCFDSCGPANCAACAAKGCSVGQVCCGKGGNVACKAKCP